MSQLLQQLGDEVRGKLSNECILFIYITCKALYIYPMVFALPMEPFYTLTRLTLFQEGLLLRRRQLVPSPHICQSLSIALDLRLKVK